MLNFSIGVCPKCRVRSKLMQNNNPLLGQSLCFNCLNSTIDINNLEHADLFCRTYNLPFDPQLWTTLLTNASSTLLETYTSTVLSDEANKPNLYYNSSTHDLWSRVNKEWQKRNSLTSILNAIPAVKDAYIERCHLKWGSQYTFDELVQLDSLYIRTLRANNITSPLQKQAVKLLCKINIGLEEAIRSGDSKAIKDFTSSYSSIAKEAELTNLINESRTEDITTLSELYDFCERQGFKPHFYDDINRDEVDVTMRDLKESQRKLVLEATGLQSQLEEMIAQKKRQKEELQNAAAISEEGATLNDILNFDPSELQVEQENDSDAIELEVD